MFPNLIKKTGTISKSEDQKSNNGSEAPMTSEPPKVGMVMDASDFSFGILPSNYDIYFDVAYFQIHSLYTVGDVPRFPYSRPEFLFLTTEDEISVSGDQTTRPVLVPKDPTKMLMFAGYAETINAGKTELNEDHACCKLLCISGNCCNMKEMKSIL